ncbi:B3 domain-containing protein Os03g0212300-like [Lolium perenne]|uniref:B3 domain-containing protein Os03g0212300-like n=1 Tax=Lolium perenne TaxID=4522 RepID=UPI0021F5E3F4|nr:B3 domain-containing protein Os03g0212300-like [Lolium perenne]
MQEEERHVLFEFVVILKGDPHAIQRLPDTFADFVAGDGCPGSLHLREVACGCCRWILDVIYDVHGKMYLHISWEKFVRYHRLEANFVLMFSYLGERDMSVKVFDETRCRRHYHGETTEEDDK